MKKKLLLLTALLSLIPTISLAGDLVELKSGEQMAGQILKLEKGKINFNFKGNVLNLKTNDVKAIYFNTSTIIKPVVAAVKPEKATINGVVTFFYNKNYGFKPDTGAEIYILNKKDAANIHPDVIKDFVNISFNKRLIDSYSSMGSQPPQDLYDDLKKYGIETDEQFKDYCSKTYKELLEFKFNDKTIKLNADGNGNFSKKLDNGEYLVLITSKNRNTTNMVEMDGNVFFKTVDLKPEDELSINPKFDMRRVSE